MAIVMVDPVSGGGTSVPTLTPTVHSKRINNFVYLPDKHLYKGAEDILCTGEVPAYNLSSNLTSNNGYGYVANVSTTAFMPNIGQIYANSGSYSFDFFSVFKLSEEPDTVDDTTVGLNGTPIDVWQSIQCSDFDIYFEDELKNKISLDKVSLFTESNAFGEYDYEAEATRDKVLELIESSVQGAIEYAIEKAIPIPFVGGLISKALFSIPPSTGIDMQHIGIEHNYYKKKGKANIKFSWGLFDGLDQTQPGFRQELCFGVRISFFTPPKPGNYDLVFAQRVYVDQSYYCTPPLDDTEYKWALGGEKGNMWMRKFEIKFPVQFVTGDVQVTPEQPGDTNITVKPTNRFVLNTNSKEIHDTLSKKHGCNLGSILEDNKRYLNTLDEVEKTIDEEGYNGCAHCMAYYDTSSSPAPEPEPGGEPVTEPISGGSSEPDKPPRTEPPDIELPISPKPVVDPEPEPER